MPTLYEILELEADATTAEVREAFRDLAKVYHPDAGSDSDPIKFQAISEAYETLSNPDSKRTYDSKLNYSRHQNPSAHEEEAKGSDTLFGGKPKPKPSGTRKSSKNLFGSTSAKPSAGLFNRLRKTVAKNTGSEEGGKFVDLRDERIFQFSIDTLESIRGTERELVLPGEREPERLKVQIPAGVRNNEVIMIETNLPDYGTVQGRVTIQATEFLAREGADIVIKVPVTIAEALTNGEIEVPVVNGTVRVKLTKEQGTLKRLRLADKGILSTDDFQGDVIVHPYIVLPDKDTDNLKLMAQAIGDFYLQNVRSKLPRKL